MMDITNLATTKDTIKRGTTVRVLINGVGIEEDEIEMATIGQEAIARALAETDLETSEICPLAAH